MTRIYLDPTTLQLQSGGPDAPEDQVAPGATDSIGHLVEAGFDVVVLGSPTDGPLDELAGGLERASDLPEHLAADDWYLTSEPHPAFGRPKGGTTVLVGPKRPPGTFPLPRFDLEVRDLSSAVMEILTRQAMA